MAKVSQRACCTAVTVIGRTVFVLRCVWADVSLSRIVLTIPLGYRGEQPSL